MLWHKDAAPARRPRRHRPARRLLLRRLPARRAPWRASRPSCRRREARRAGGPVIGICNGFQVLCESGLLPGALVRNRDLRFVCDDVRSRPADSGQLRGSERRARAADQARRGRLRARPEAAPRVAFRYRGENPNGTTDGIAGVVSERGNVLGLMPHPEHAVDPLTRRDRRARPAERASSRPAPPRGERMTTPSSTASWRSSTGSATRSGSGSSRSWAARPPSRSSGSSR